MTDTIAPFPGGKSKLEDWIISEMPAHSCYVEPFGGMAGVLVNKQRSEIEIYNDLDSELYNFFTVLRDNVDALVEWLDQTPYSREMHDEFAEELYGTADWPTDSVERAGRFFYLRYTQFGARYDGDAGFAFSKTQNEARPYENAKKQLETFADRFTGVMIENLPWRKCMDNYDADDTLFYCDPPYIGSEAKYRCSDFDHQAFVEYLHGVDGYWMVSYDQLPNGLEDYTVKTKDENYYIGNGKAGASKGVTEHLVLNFDPAEEPPFRREVNFF